MRIHGVISQKAVILILDAVRTRNVTFPSYTEDISESNSEDNDVAQTQIIWANNTNGNNTYFSEHHVYI
jgi:hypothetical protein